MQNNDIGDKAGRVWQLLDERGEMTPTAVSKDLGMKPAEIDRAIGWLAREDKLCFSVDKRGATRMSIKQG